VVKEEGVWLKEPVGVRARPGLSLEEDPAQSL